MFFYTAYCLGVASALSMPELQEGQGPPAVTVRFGQVNFPSPPEVFPGYQVLATQEEVYLFWEGEGSYLVRGGREIIMNPMPGTAEQALRLTVLGPLLAVLLGQRGLMVFHASGVVINGGAAIFLGEAGQGKSTLAAALHARGYPVLADDIVPVQDGENGPLALPGFPRLKLSPGAARRLGKDPEKLPRIHPGEEKRLYRVDQGFPQEPVRLRRIYLLSQAPDQGIEPVPPQEALLALMLQSHAFALLYAINSPAYFLQCANLIKQVSVRRLRVTRSMAVLPDLVTLVEEDFAREE